MSNWQKYPFPKTIVKTKIGRANQINSSEINSSGRFPVVDQGQAYIAGYSDEESKVVKVDLPVIIFGDHTRCVKYVDFPFILGADGTKVLKPRNKVTFAVFTVEDDLDKVTAIVDDLLNLLQKGKRI